MRVDPKKIVITYKKYENVTRTAKELGIHKSTVSRWLKRANTGYPYGKRRYSSRGLQRRSTAPKTRPREALSPADRVAIENVRKEYGFDARKIVAFCGLDASHMTVYRFLKRKGLTNAEADHRRPAYQNTVHMHARNATTIGYLQMDVKYVTPELSGLPWTCYEYALIDIYSRYKDGIILNQLDQDGAILALTTMLNRLPFSPVFIQTDNGFEFQKRFRSFVEAQGLEHHYIHKKAPNENAVIERSFRTDEEEFFARYAKPEHYDELREQFAAFLSWYNSMRPHFALSLQTPHSIISQSTTN